MRGLDIEELARAPGLYPWPGAFDVSPDGKLVAFVWNKSGQWDVYLAPVAGGEPDGGSLCITSGPESKIAPRWSPDGRTLAYVQDHQGDELFDIWLYDARTGAHRNLTPDSPDAIYPMVSWSPDGARLAFTSNRSGKFAVYTLPVEGGAATLVCDHPYSDFSPEWSPDGKWIAFPALVTGQDTHLFLAPADGGEVRRVAGPDGPIDAAWPRWSPDSRRLAFVSRASGKSDVGVYDLESGALTWLADPEWEAYWPDWSPDGRRLVYALNRDGNYDLAIRDLESGEQLSLAIGPGIHAYPRFLPGGEALIFTYQGAGHPPDLWVAAFTERVRYRQLTQSLPASLADAAFVTPRVVRYTGFDGRSIAALLYQPGRGEPPYAAVVFIHGGPSAQQTNVWEPAIQHLVSQGYLVLAPNYRGSTGYGKAFQELNRFDLGGGDLKDVIAGAEYLVSAGLADPRRLAVTGGSYGGYLTMMALTKDPERWAAGVCIVGFLNWVTEYENEREDLKYWDLQNMGDPVKDADRYYDRSPIHFMDRIQAPVLFLHGANDPRCPLEEMEQAVDVLARLGKPYEFKVYPDEGHSFRRIENKVDAFRRRAEFLERYLR